MFEGFSRWHRDVGNGVIRTAVTAATDHPWCCCTVTHGPHSTWYRVAPQLESAGFRVVCPDLRGYGQSSVPPTTADHSPYAKRAMAADVVTVMRDPGHQRFAVAGHDRGSNVAMRLAP